MNRLQKQEENMKRIIFIIVLISAMALMWAEDKDLICGKWYTENNKSIVEVFKKDNLYYGKILWLKEPLDESGKAKLDKENPTPALRSKPLINLQVLNGLKAQGNNKWADGKIYDPKNGKTYDVKATLVNKDKIEIRGFIGVSLLGRTTTWVRVDK